MLVASPQFAHAQLVNTATVTGTPDAGVLADATATESVPLISLVVAADDTATAQAGDTGVLNLLDGDTVNG